MNLIMRFVTGSVLVPLTLYCLYKGGIVFSLGMVLVSVVAILECLWMVFGWFTFSGMVCGFLFALSLPLYMFYLNTIVKWPYAVFFLFLIFCLYAVHARSFSKIKLEKSAVVFAFSLYMMLGLYSIVCLRLDILGIPSGFSWIFLGLACVWANDSFAYFCGKWFGKHPFYPSITRKTWEGFIGGTLGTLVVPFILIELMQLCDLHWAWGIEERDVLWVALPVCFLAPLGDLVESRFKRLYDVKDSSKLLPGHGGVLDRIDSLLFVMPWIYFYVHAIRF